ncbi:MAG: hypothetical protein SOT41_05035 [Candidatus Faecisoma sp.]|nr:hypothetical protein [Acholeplasma sp.]MDY2893122.1 hypothetical protein [Candidatus Faecisoma sp.]
MKKVLLGTIFTMLFTFGFIFNVDAKETIKNKIEKITTGEIVLDEDYTENVTIPEGKNITIDLNGNTLTGEINVLGTLTVKSSKEGGQIVKTDGEQNNAAIYVGDFNEETKTKIEGKFTLESGSVISEKGFGIACFSGSTATINGGEVKAVYSGLSGNNTLGSMNFIINGGVITAQYGPAIYMPGPVSLKMTNGTLNGGISLRMGKVNISGGIINAATADFDSFGDYYYKSVNAWLEDALYVWGGTYTSKDEGTTNILDLNITGGTFNASNKLGSAVAIYDIGKVSQEIKVNISGNAKLLTNSLNRNAYDVLTLSDAGVTNIKAGYNNPEFVGKIKTAITGGTFSTSVLPYLTNEYVETEINNQFVVEKQKVNVDAPVVDGINVKEVTMGVKKTSELEEVLKSSLTKSQIDFEGFNPTVKIIIVKQDKEQVQAETLKNIKKFIEEKNNNIKTSDYFDITLNVLEPRTQEIMGILNELTGKVQFEIAIPDDLKQVSKEYSRTFYIIREHEGEVEILPTTLKDGKLLFETDKFSTYVLAYEDIKNPKTFDSTISYITLGLTSLLCLSGASIVLKSRKENE